MNNMKGISKVKGGYMVRIYRNGSNSTTSFSISKYGSDEEALRAAISFRDTAEKEIPPTPKKDPLALKADGLPKGVTLTHTYGNTGNKIPCYQVTWGFPIRHKQRFTFLESDEQSKQEALKQALALAKAVRGLK